MVDRTDLYGQILVNESPELLKTTLLGFDEKVTELTTRKGEDNECFLEATEKCPEQLTRDFKFLFLRSEKFNVDEAAARYLRYWKKRVEIFGRSKAFLPLSREGALSDDTDFLDCGLVSVTHGRDKEGRSIVHADPAFYTPTTMSKRVCCLRSIWYIIHKTLENEAAQQLGVVMIIDASRASMSQFDMKLEREALECLKHALPVRLSAFHICRPSLLISLVLIPLFRLVMPSKMQNRLFVHRGWITQVTRRLANYGIDSKCVAKSLGGTFDAEERSSTLCDDDEGNSSTILSSL